MWCAATVHSVVQIECYVTKREREAHTQQVSDEGTYLREPVSFPFLQTCTGDKKNKQRATIIYTTKREDKVIDSESCVNVREWHACVNMGDRLLSMFVWMRAVCVFEQCDFATNDFCLHKTGFKTWVYIASRMLRWCFDRQRASTLKSESS